MKTSAYIILLLQITCFSHSAFAVTPSQRAAINIWLQQQQNINPRPINIIATLKNKAQRHNIKITRYNINSNKVEINARSKTKSNIFQYKRILDTTFMFDKISISKRQNKSNHFKLKLTKANLDNKGEFKKSNHQIYKSNTQVKYSIINLIDSITPWGTLQSFCPSKPLKLKPNYVGARIKLIIFSYHLKFSGTFKKINQVLNLISNNKKYISMHNLILKNNGSTYNLEIDLRFYQEGSRRNNVDKPFIYKKVKSNKICNK